MGTGDIQLEGNPAIMSRVRGRGVAILLGMLQGWEQGGVACFMLRKPGKAPGVTKTKTLEN